MNQQRFIVSAGRYSHPSVHNTRIILHRLQRMGGRFRPISFGTVAATANECAVAYVYIRDGGWAGDSICMEYTLRAARRQR